jgi:hypothetical protein
MVGNGDRRWLWFRMALLVSCVEATTFQLESMKDDFSQPSLSFAVLMTSGTALVMFAKAWGSYSFSGRPKPTVA